MNGVTTLKQTLNIWNIYQEKVYKRQQRFRDFYKKATEWADEQGCTISRDNTDVVWNSESDKLMFIMRYM